MCLSYDPVTNEPDGGHEKVRRRYVLWAEATLNHMWECQESLDAARESVRLHVESIMAIKNPHFSYI